MKTLPIPNQVVHAGWQVVAWAGGRVQVCKMVCATIRDGLETVNHENQMGGWWGEAEVPVLPGEGRERVVGTKNAIGGRLAGTGCPLPAPHPVPAPGPSQWAQCSSIESRFQTARDQRRVAGRRAACAFSRREAALQVKRQDAGRLYSHCHPWVAVGPVLESEWGGGCCTMSTVKVPELEGGNT